MNKNQVQKNSELGAQEFPKLKVATMPQQILEDNFTFTIKPTKWDKSYEAIMQRDNQKINRRTGNTVQASCKY